MICSVLLKAVLAHLISEWGVDVVWDDVVYMYVCSGAHNNFERASQLDQLGPPLALCSSESASNHKTDGKPVCTYAY